MYLVSTKIYKNEREWFDLMSDEGVKMGDGTAYPSLARADAYGFSALDEFHTRQRELSLAVRSLLNL